jgi:hypothetical protein
MADATVDGPDRLVQLLTFAVDDKARGLFLQQTSPNLRPGQVRDRNVLAYESEVAAIEGERHYLAAKQDQSGTRARLARLVLGTCCMLAW